MRTLPALVLCGVLSVVPITSFAQDSYIVGRIIDVTFVGDAMLIVMDSGVPANCAGPPYMMIPAASKPMMAFVIGLKLSGEMSQLRVEVYASPVNSSGYCQVIQLDPADVRR